MVSPTSPRLVGSIRWKGARRAGFVAIVAAAGAVGASCNAILGNEDGHFDPALAIGGVGGGDAGAGAADGADGAAIACDADTTRDPANCGACGHDCHGGACSASECGAVGVVGDGGVATSLGANTTAVFWGTTDGFVRSALVDGGAPTTVYSGPSAVLAVAATDDVVYFITQGASSRENVFRCAPTGCGASPDAVHAVVASELDLSLSGTTLLVVTQQTAVTAIAAGGAMQTLSSGGDPRHAVGLGDDVFWSTGIDGGTIERTTLAAQVPAHVADGTSPVGAHLTFDGRHLYWTNPVGREIEWCLPDAGGRATFAPTGSDSVEALVADGTYLYWQEGARVVRCRSSAPCPSAAAPVSDGTGLPIAFATNTTFVFWIDQRGRVYRVAR